MIFFFLSSGLFLGWSLGANDAANIFGTAVGTKMVRFKVAAITASIFVTLGAVIGGAGATHTLGKLGGVNAIAGAFMVAFAAAFTVFMMTKYRLPVSTSQAIVGAIIGWNIYAEMLTDANSLTKILSTWVLCPVISAVFAIALYLGIKWLRGIFRVNIFRDDMFTRIGLIAIGAFGAYSLGANNIANVMGVFVSAEPFAPLDVFGLFTLSGAQILFLIGGIAISVGIITYSHKVMDTVGGSLLKLSPITALIVVVAESVVLYIFSSVSLESWLIGHGLPSIPLVPVSSSQAVVGAVIGIGMMKNFRLIRLKVLGEIALGWVITPISAGIITFVFLFFLQNVFNNKVYTEADYRINDKAIAHLKNSNIDDPVLEKISGKVYNSEFEMYDDIQQNSGLSRSQAATIIGAAKLDPIMVDSTLLANKVDSTWLSPRQFAALNSMRNQKFDYSWAFSDELGHKSIAWKKKETSLKNKNYNKAINEKLEYVKRIFAVK